MVLHGLPIVTTPSRHQHALMSGSYKVAILVVTHQSKVEKVDEHHWQNDQEDRMDEDNQQ